MCILYIFFKKNTPTNYELTFSASVIFLFTFRLNDVTWSTFWGTRVFVFFFSPNHFLYTLWQLNGIQDSLRLGYSNFCKLEKCIKPKENKLPNWCRISSINKKSEWKTFTRGFVPFCEAKRFVQKQVHQTQWKKMMRTTWWIYLICRSTSFWWKYLIPQFGPNLSSRENGSSTCTSSSIFKHTPLSKIKTHLAICVGLNENWWFSAKTLPRTVCWKSLTNRMEGAKIIV